MEQGSPCHFGMAFWVATLLTPVGINIPVQYAACRNPKLRGHDSKGKQKPRTDNFRTTKNDGQTTLEAKSVDFSPFWCTKDPLHSRPR